MKLLTTALIAGLSLIAAQAHSQTVPGAQQAAFNFGLANPVSDGDVDGQSRDFGGIGPAFGFSYHYQLQRYLSIGGDFSFKNLGEDEFSSPRGPVEVEYSAWTLLATARGDLFPDGNLRPYGLAGLGVGGVKREVEYDLNPRFDSSRTSNGMAFALGGGVDYDINASWLAGAELRYNIIDTSESEIGASSVSTLDILFKVGYKF